MVNGDILRPRISQKEAAYLCTILKSELVKLKEKYAEYEMLKSEMLMAKIEIKNRYRGNYEMLAVIEYYKQVKDALSEGEHESYRLWKTIDSHTKLLSKYSAIAEGEPHDGRYKRLSCADVRFPEAPMLVLENGTATT